MLPPHSTAATQAAPSARAGLAAYAERRAIWNLWPLLVHAYLFGGSYAGSVSRVLGRYV